MAGSCSKCRTPLTPDNWHPSKRARGQCVCKTCVRQECKTWKAENKSAVRAQKRRQYIRKKLGTEQKIRSRLAVARAEVHWLESLLRSAASPTGPACTTT
jgi:hypothetical protein